MDEKFKEDLDNRMNSLTEDLSVLKKEKQFYEFLKNSTSGEKISEISGSYQHGFRIQGSDYSLVDDFEFNVESANRYDFLADTHASRIGVLKFFTDSKFKEHNARYNLVDKELDKSEMNFLYVLNIDNTDYSGTPLTGMGGPSFSCPKMLNEMKKFYLSKGMNKDLVSRVINDVGIVRKALGRSNK